MRCTIRSLLSMAFTGAIVSYGWAGAIPSPFAEPETSRPPAVKKAPETPPPGDDIMAPSELPPVGRGVPESVERETLAPLDATPAPALPADQPGPAMTDAPSSPANTGSGNSKPIGGPAAPASAAQPAAPPSPANERSRMVTRDERSPPMTGEGSGLPYDLWQGMTIEEVEKTFAGLEIPPRSPALHALFRRLIAPEVPPPQGTDARFAAVSVDALERSGLIDEAAAVLSKQPPSSGDPILTLLAARMAIARGNRDEGCRNVQAINAGQAGLPMPLKSQSILVRAFCAAASGQKESAELQVALARDEGMAELAGFSAIDAIATGSKPALAKGQTAGPLDWRILELGGPIDQIALVDAAGPGLLAFLARDSSFTPALRLAAIERAVQLNAITALDLATAYRAYGGDSVGAEGAGGQATKHAAMFQAADDEATPLKKARLIRSFLDDMRTAGLYWPALKIMAPAAASIPRVPEIGWFAESAIETGLASGNFSLARDWAEFGATLDHPDAGAVSYVHWLALADLADPALTDGRSRQLDAVQEMAARGRFSPDQLHRMATVLDALQIKVPIPLWELASRTPQPNTGFLPETGVLSALSDAAKKGQFARTVLLAMQSLGPSGAEGAHIIALGDSIRALRSAGLDGDARALALEALFMIWPRVTG